MKPYPTDVDYSTWKLAASRVLYFLETCVHDHMLGYFQDAKTLKESWDNLKFRFSRLVRPHESFTSANS